MPNRSELLKTGMRLEIYTIAWMLTEGACTIFAGIVTGSALLLAVGAGATVDMLSACALWWRMRLEAKDKGHRDFHRLEKRTARLVGCLLFATAAYALAIAGYKFITKTAPSNSILGISVALVAAVWMPFLAKKKCDVAKILTSRALYADGVGTLVCGLMSAVVLIGLVGNALLHWWWLDSIGAVLLVPLLAKEAWEAFQNESFDEAPSQE